MARVMVKDWWRPFAADGGIAVFHVDLAPHPQREREAARWLDGSERERCGRFLVERPRREYRLCRAALRALLCRRLGCANDDLAFASAQHGKPFALVDGAPATVSFNVSHSGGHGLIAVADRGSVGVDVEERVIRHDIDGVLRTAFAPDEQGDLAAANGSRKAELFFRMWTMKEALIKALGSGFSLDTASFTLPAALRRGTAKTGRVRLPCDTRVEWLLSDLGNAEFAAALAHDDGAGHRSQVPALPVDVTRSALRAVARSPC